MKQRTTKIFPGLDFRSQFYYSYDTILYIVQSALKTCKCVRKKTKHISKLGMVVVFTDQGWF